MRTILMTTAALLMATSAMADSHSPSCPNYNSAPGRQASITPDADGNNCYGNPVLVVDPGREAQDRQNAADQEAAEAEAAAAAAE